MYLTPSNIFSDCMNQLQFLTLRFLPHLLANSFNASLLSTQQLHILIF